MSRDACSSHLRDVQRHVAAARRALDAATLAARVDGEVLSGSAMCDGKFQCVENCVASILAERAGRDRHAD